MGKKRQLLLRAVLTPLNVELRLVPIAVTAVMITIEMRAAISPYSIAVAPASFSRNAAQMPFVSLPGSSILLIQVPPLVSQPRDGWSHGLR